MTRLSTGYRSNTVSHGSSSSCLMPSETRSLARSNLRILTVTSRPTWSISEGCVMRPYDISVTCSRPSMPPRSMKAPYSVRFFTVPTTVAPSERCSRVTLLRELISSSSASLRETTTLARGLGVREQHVAFHLFAAVDHDIDHIAALHRHFAGGGLKLVDRDDAFGLVSEIDDDVFGGDADRKSVV